MVLRVHEEEGEPSRGISMEDPIAVLSELVETAMRRLGADFKVTVKGDYKELPVTLTTTVEEYER
ncbi:hypothetical protein KEJ15_06790, partial [Candidatus Bathyarchaeota archaeon]|nr:hypothetical protein [Candidatus Bathyarchaeota archaeon]